MIALLAIVAALPACTTVKETGRMQLMMSDSADQGKRKCAHLPAK